MISPEDAEVKDMPDAPLMGGTLLQGSRVLQYHDLCRLLLPDIEGQGSLDWLN